MRIVFYPLWLIIKGHEKLVVWLNSKEVWSEARADEILSYYIPRRADWVKEENIFYFFDNGMGWNLSFAKKYLKRKDRRFWNIHRAFVGGNIRRYLIEKFELEGFQKIVENCNDGWTEIIFKKL